MCTLAPQQPQRRCTRQTQDPLGQEAVQSLGSGPQIARGIAQRIYGFDPDKWAAERTWPLYDHTPSASHAFFFDPRILKDMCCPAELFVGASRVASG